MNNSNLQGQTPCQQAQMQDAYSDILSQNLATHSNGNAFIGTLAGDSTLAGIVQAGGPYAPTQSGSVGTQQQTQATGLPIGTAGAPGAQPGITAADLLPITPLTQAAPQTVQNVQFLNGALRTQIGKRISVSFLIGTNTFVDKTGMLLAVGANYLLMLEENTDDLLFCDFFTIKFVTIYR